MYPSRLALLGLLCLAFFARAAAPFVPGRLGADGESLPDEALFRLGTTRLRLTGEIKLLGFSGDGRRVLATAGDPLHFWDTASWRIAERPEKLSCSPWATALSPDGRLVALEDGGKIYLHDATTGKRLRTLAGRGKAPFDRFRFSAGGKVLAGWRGPPAARSIPGEAGEVALWETASGRQVGSAVLPAREVRSVAPAGDGKKFLALLRRDGSDGLSVLDCDVAPGKKEVLFALEDTPTGFVVSSAGQVGLLGLTKDRESPFEIFLWDSGGRRRLKLPAGKSPRPGVECFAFTPDGKSLIAAAEDELTWLSADTGKELRRLPGDFAGVSGLALSLDGKKLVLAQKQSLRVLDPATGKDLSPTAGHRGGLVQMACRGRLLATGGSDESIRVWDTASGRELAHLGGRGVGVCSPVLSEDGSLLASVDSGYDSVHVWDPRTGQHVREIPLSPVGHLSLSPDGRTAAVRHPLSPLRLVEVRSGKTLCSFKEGHDALGSLAFTADGRALLFCAGFEVFRCDVAAGKIARRIAVPRPDVPDPPTAGSPDSCFHWTTFSKSGRFLAYAHRAGYLVVADLERDAVLGSLPCPSRWAEMAFSPDERTLAWVDSGEATIHLVEVATSRERHRFPGHEGGTAALAFSPDGRVLYSGGNDTTVLAWDLTGRLLLKAEWGKPVGARGLRECWARLGEGDSGGTYRSGRRLAGSPGEAIPFLRERLLSFPRVERKQVAGLAARLDSEAYQSRLRAAEELKGLDFHALEYCREALGGKLPLEALRRLEGVVRHQERSWREGPDGLRCRRAVEVLESVGSPEARRALEEVAAGAPGSALAAEVREALARLGRPSSRPLACFL